MKTLSFRLPFKLTALLAALPQNGQLCFFSLNVVGVLADCIESLRIKAQGACVCVCVCVDVPSDLKANLHHLLLCLGAWAGASHATQEDGQVTHNTRSIICLQVR